MIGRVFINKDSTISLKASGKWAVIQQFQSSVLNRDSARNIVESAIRYT
jgi:hypothetical protein